MISLSAVVWKIEPLRSSSSRKHVGIDQVAIMSDRDLAADAIDHERLRVLQSCSFRWWNSECAERAGSL